jgi:hypothetical protein
MEIIEFLQIIIYLHTENDKVMFACFGLERILRRCDQKSKKKLCKRDATPHLYQSDGASN